MVLRWIIRVVFVAAAFVVGYVTAFFAFANFSWDAGTAQELLSRPFPTPQDRLDLIMRLVGVPAGGFAAYRTRGLTSPDKSTIRPDTARWRAAFVACFLVVLVSWGGGGLWGDALGLPIALAVAALGAWMTFRFDASADRRRDTRVRIWPTWMILVVIVALAATGYAVQG